MSTMSEILLYTASIIAILWGIAHIIPTKNVVKGFEPISEDNKRILTMDWVAEGLTMIFIGLLALFVTIAGGTLIPISLIAYRGSGLMLIVMAVLTALTAGRTSVIFFKICPIIIIKTMAAGLFLIGSLL